MLVLTGTGLILAAVLILGYYQARRMLEQETKAKARYLAQSTAYRIETVTKAVEKTVAGMRNHFEEALPPSGEEACRILKRAVLETAEVYGAGLALASQTTTSSRDYIVPYVYRSDGRIVSDDLGRKKHYSYQMQDWFVLPKELGYPVWSEPYYDVGGGNILMVTYAAPLFDHAHNDAFLGVVTCDVSLAWLSDLLSKVSLGPGGYAFLISADGTYISHPNKNLILKENIFSRAEALCDPSMRRLGQRMIHGESDYVPFMSPSMGEPSWMVFVPVPSTGWTLSAVFPQKELMARVFELTRHELWIAAAGFVLLLAVVLLIARSISRPIRKLDQAAMTLASGNLDVALPVISGGGEIAELGESFATMRDQLKEHIRRLADTVAAQERLASELRIAHDIQMSLVPKSFPKRADMDLCALMHPAREVGGDFYDFFFLDNNHLCLAIGDVSGKGVPAALFMAVTRSFLRSMFRQETSPATILGWLNDELASENEACMFVTLFCAVVDLPSGQCRFANGGHPLPQLLHADETITPLAKLRGTPIGALPDASFEEGSLVLEHGDALFLYTDGVTEAMNPHLELFEEERMVAALWRARRGSCADLVREVEQAIRAFTQGTEQSDDITQLAFRRM